MLTQTWRACCSDDPVCRWPVPGQLKHVLGGEAALWGEHVDGANLEPVPFEQQACKMTTKRWAGFLIPSL